MPVTPASLLSPSGELVRSLVFPGMVDADVDQWLTDRIAEGRAAAVAAGITDEAKLDASSRHWTYARAFYERWQALLLSPASKTLEGLGSTSVQSTQISRLESLYREHDSAYRNALLVIEPPAQPFVSPMPTVSVRTEISW